MRPAGLVGALVGAAIALAPGSLPRALPVHLTTLAVCLLLGAAVGTGLGRLAAGPRPPTTARTTTLTVGVVVTYVALVAANTLWQSALRAHLDGASPLGPGWLLWSSAPGVAYLAVAVVPLRPRALVALAVGLAAGVVAVGAGSSTAARPTETPRAVVDPPVLQLRSTLAGTDDGGRARALVRRWLDAGGADRSVVVVAVPTGSGWVDPDAITGFTRRFAGDVSVLSMQFDDSPSWEAFVAGTGPAQHSAIALVDAVTSAVATLPHDHRPDVVLYGQSLGAIGADAARSWAQARHRPVCATVIAGPPAGTVAPQASRRVVVANASDPVTRWSPATLVVAPHRWDGPADLPRPPWFPVASFVQTSIDLVGSLSFPAGHGHQYGTEQGTRVPRCV
jgi:uncharacterized membrane protein